MTTWYVDYEGGIDANASVGNGDSFATRRKRIDNCVAAAIAPGDVIRVMASPTPTLVGNATWTDGPLNARTGGNGATNATPIVYTNLNHTVVAGDTVIVDNVAGNTAANGVWKVGTVVGDAYELLNADGSPSVGNGTTTANGASRKITNSVVTLASAVTQNIALCGNRGQKGNWTGADANNVPTVLTTDYKEGGECQQIVIAADMTTGLSAYYATGTLDLSAYQQVSFWIKQTVGSLGEANFLSLKLCSDTAGATPVDTINIPYLGALSQWSPIVVDTGGALGSSIQSIALYVNTDNGAKTFLIDNIIACKASSAADSLNLTSLISKDPGDHSFGDTYECYWGIQSINGTRVMLDGPVSTTPANNPQRGYSGTTETVATYKRETTKTVMGATSATVAQSVKEAGLEANRIHVRGGWNRTDMSTQTGETWFDGQNGFGYGLSNETRQYLNYDKLNFSRYYYGLYDGGGGADIDLGRMEFSNTTGAPTICTQMRRLSANVISAVACGGAISPGTGAVVTTIGRADGTTSGNGVTLGAASWTGTIIQANNNTANGVNLGYGSRLDLAPSVSFNGFYGLLLAELSSVGSVVANSNAYQGVASSGNVNATVFGGSTSGNGAGIQVSTGTTVLRNFTINEVLEVYGHSANPYFDARVYSEKHDGVNGNTQVFCDGGLISQQASVVHGAATSAWKFSPTSTNRAANYPLNLPIAQIAVAANALVTVTAWVRRSNTALTSQLICKGGQLAGVASDVIASMTAAADTWEQLTLTFTPTEAGVIEIEAQFYGGSTYNGYVSDATFNQA